MELGLVLLRGIDDTIMKNGIPEFVFAMFQGKFAIITPALIAGAFAERVRFRGYVVFIALWSVLVYNPLAHWVWAPDGFLYQLGAIDFAGGTVVHISAGVSGLVAALYLGARRGYPRTAMHPNNLVMMMMGVGLLWVGWFGFNAGSSVSSGVKTAQALTVTQVAAASAALTWISSRPCTTARPPVWASPPASSPVSSPSRRLRGSSRPRAPWRWASSRRACAYGAILLKNRLGYDDTLDVFGVHGIAGIAGAVLLTFFIRAVDMPAGKDTLSQLGVQLFSVAVTIGFGAIMTIGLVVFVEKMFGLRLGTTGEMAGMDHELHGEHGYGLLNLNEPGAWETYGMKFDSWPSSSRQGGRGTPGPHRCRDLPHHGQSRDGARSSGGSGAVSRRGGRTEPDRPRCAWRSPSTRHSSNRPSRRSSKAARHGDGVIGDGKIFILPLEEVIRIRTGERGGEAI